MQKTSYEMRISDWSSDVCSSDLIRRGGATLCHPKSVTRRRLYRDLARLLHDGASGAPPLAGRRALIADNNKANSRRSEECRVGKELGSTYRSRWSPYH